MSSFKCPYFPQGLLDFCRENNYITTRRNGQRITCKITNVVEPANTEIFVGRLDPLIFEDTLLPIFMGAGEIYKFRMVLHHNNMNRCYCFVKYYTPEEAKRAITLFNDMQVGRNKIYVTKSMNNCRLYFGGLPMNWTTEQIETRLRSDLPDIVSVEFPEPIYSDFHHKGFAFVEFENHRAAALSRVPFQFTRDYSAKVDWAVPLPDIDDELMAEVKTVYVRNLKETESKQDFVRYLTNIMEQYTIKKVIRKCCIAYIEFHTRNDALICLDRIEHYLFNNRKLKANLAAPKEFKNLMIRTADGLVPKHRCLAVPRHMRLRILAYREKEYQEKQMMQILNGD